MIEQVAWHRKLTVRVLLFLTLALVPLGAIGILQNAELFKATERRTELSLLALTESAASGERQLIQRTFGAAEALGSAVKSILDDPERCSNNLQRFLDSNDAVVYAGFLPVDGISTCSTAGRTLDFSDNPRFRDHVQNPRPSVEINLNAPGSGQSVMIVSQPRYEQGNLQGFLSISLPLDQVGKATDSHRGTSTLMLVTLNTEGEVLSTEGNRADAINEMPRAFDMQNLVQGDARTFKAKNNAGVERLYSIIPVVPDVVYAMAAFTNDAPSATGLSKPQINSLLPFLMWAASLMVAWFAIDRLVLTRISDLYINMQKFARDRTVPKIERRGSVSGELQILESAFMGMVQDLLQDEAEQEAQIREKSILLKEVHHRVKNNLQIISSIMNMQIRKANAPETKRALSQVQDRIMALSGVHRTLYQAESLTKIDAAMLVAKIIDESMVMGKSGEQDIQVETDLDPMTVFPDQAVPLAMLVAETLTNALKYCEPDKKNQSTISVALKRRDGEKATYCIENTKAVTSLEPVDGKLSTGLGQQLIKAFAIQLNGQLQVTESNEIHSVVVDFEVEDFKETDVDY